VSRLTAAIGRLRSARGSDPRSTAEAWWERLRGEPGTAHVFGDSQTHTYVGLPRMVVHTRLARSMHRAAMDGPLFPRWLSLLVGRRSTLVFAYGNVDVRRHIGRIAAERGLPVEHVVDDLVARYMAAIETARAGRRVVVVAPMAPGTNAAILPRFGAWGSEEQRVDVRQQVTAALARACAPLGFGFVDSSASYSDPRGCLKREFSDDGVHLLPGVRGPAIEALRSALDLR